MSTSNSIRRAVRCALVTSAAAAVAATTLPVYAADETIQEIIVTGSRIRREDTGALPVTAITREAIDAAGETSITEILRNTTFNSFGSFAAQSGSSAQGGASVDLRGLGADRSLVLVNGRRVSYNPAFDGAYVNLNTVPLAAVERVDILRDGASAIYGSDAIGGVINIITRKDFEGVSVELMGTSPDEEGGEESSASVVAGIVGAKGNLMLTAEHSERGIIMSADRPYTAGGVSQLGGPGSYAYVDGADYLLFPDPRCPATIGSSSQYPLSGLGTGDNEGLCLYNYAAIAGESASVKRDAVTIDGTYSVSDNIEAFARASYSQAESFGRYAPAPAVFFDFIGPDNPINPTAVVDADGNVTTPGRMLDLYYRFTELGPRDNVFQDNVFEFLTGLRGGLNILGGAEWEAAVFHNRYNQDNTGTGYGLISNFQSAIRACEILGVDDPACYNPFEDPGPDNDARALVGHTTLQNNQYVAYGGDASISFDAFSLPAGNVGMAIGAEYRDEDFGVQYDAQSDAGNVFGSAGGSATGDRWYYGIYTEALVPIVERLEAQLALRYDKYSDFGDSVSPKIALRWNPLDSLIMRASWGEGFRAPDLVSLFGAPQQSFENASDTRACNEGLPTPAPCNANQQRETYFTSNPELDAEESDQYSLGVVWEPLADLSFTLDYYNIEINNGINLLTTQEVLDAEAACFAATGGPCDPATQGSVERGPAGQLQRVLAPRVNSATIKTDGVDFTATWSFDTDVGRFRLFGDVSYVLSFDEQVNAGQGFRDLLGYVNDEGNSGTPDWRAQTSVDWSLGSVFAGFTVNHIDSVKDCTAPPAGQPDSATGSGDCTFTLDSFTSLDAQAGYRLPWDGTLTLGARNLTGEDPPISQTGALGSDSYSIELHSQGYYGRVYYARYTQRF